MADVETEILVLLRRKLQGIIRTIDGIDNNRSRCNSFGLQVNVSPCEILAELELVVEMISQLQSLAVGESHTHTLQQTEAAMDLIEEAIQQLDIISHTSNDTIHRPTGRSGRSDIVGRPTLIIPKETLEYFLQHRFKHKDMADALNISVSTVKRRLSEFGLSIRATYSTIDDCSLNDKVKDVVNNFPCVGYRSVKAILENEGHRFHQHRIRKALKTVDPEGVLYRRLFMSSRRIQRRVYNVSGPQALWHVDGNHKLIRWRLVIHGGIDGYSRLPVYLKVSNNNKAATVLNSFMEAVAEFGLPRRVRSDKGGENILIAEYMIEKRGTSSKPFIAGRSVHNQRIERLWREVWTGCIILYHRLFHFMEEDGILNPDNEQHIQVLHAVYLKEIQDHLDRFSQCLRGRPLRTEGQRSPWQLWISGQCQNYEEDPISEDFMMLYGVDFDGPLPADINIVEVPETDSDLPVDQVTLAQILSEKSECYGVDKYQHILTLIQ